MTETQRVSAETMRFMRGKYMLDEVPGKYYDIDCLKFRQGKRTILSINIHKDHYDFQIIFGKAERERFEARLGEFPEAIQDIYNGSRALADGLWMLIRVDNLETLEAVKQMIMIKKKPNRKPFPKEQAVYGDCGHRRGLCAHCIGGTISDEFRKELRERVRRVYGLSRVRLRQSVGRIETCYRMAKHYSRRCDLGDSALCRRAIWELKAGLERSAGEQQIHHKRKPWRNNPPWPRGSSVTLVR
ncbi:MAG: DUF3788 domain-containing protein, partial [Oscillospiraceae bacterium]|nr:DUF3788 domain-containing protein [Oscillospiraceae bacterium]